MHVARQKTFKNIVLPIDSNNKTSLFVRSYSTSFTSKLNNCFSTKNISGLNELTNDVFFSNSVHYTDTGLVSSTMDQMLQKHLISEISKDPNFDLAAYTVHSFYDQFKELGITPDPNLFKGRQQVFQRSNTVAEILCADASEKLFDVKTKFSFTSNFTSNPIYQYQTGNTNPDFIMIKILSDGRTFEFRIDLKLRNLNAFRSLLANYSPDAIIHCNIYYLGGMTKNFIFTNSERQRLIDVYFNCLDFHKANGSSDLVNQLHKDSLPFLNNFLKHGNYQYYNELSTNTPKFLAADVLRELHKL